MNLNFHSSFSNSDDQKRNKISGVMVGMVTNNNDPEGLGRVKLNLPIRESVNETDWVRVATLMGGANMGSYVVPEVGDEVLVSFHLGEVRIPYVIGTLWSNKNKPPKVDTKNNNIRKFKSKSGHEIIFDDHEDSGSIEIKTKSGHVIQLDDQKDHIQMVDKSGNSFVNISGGTKNEITVQSGNSTIKLNKIGDMVVESAKSLKIKSPQIAIEATASLDIKAGASLNIKSDGLVKINGAVVQIN